MSKNTRKEYQAGHNASPKPSTTHRWQLVIPRLVERLAGILESRLGLVPATFVLAAGASALFVFLQLGTLGSVDLNFTEGSVAPRDVRVNNDVLVEDPLATKIARQTAKNSILPIYVLDPEISFLAMDRLENFVKYVKEQDASVSNSELVGLVEDQFGLTFEASYLRTLRNLVAQQDIWPKVRTLLNKLYQNWIVPDRELLRGKHGRGVQIHFLDGSSEGNLVVITPDQYDRILGLNEARSYLQEVARSALQDTRAWERLQLVRLAADSARPNLIFNQAKTEDEAEQAAANVKPVLLRFVKGEIVIRDGDRISAEDLRRIELLKTGLDQRSTWRFAVGAALFAFLVFLLMLLAGTKSSWRAPNSIKDRIFIVVSAIGLLLALVLSQPIIEGVHRGFPWISTSVLMLGFPAASITMLARAVYAPRYALLVAIVSSVLVGFITGNPWSVFVYIAGGVAVSVGLRHIRRRSMFFVIGFQSGALQAAMAVAIYLVREVQDVQMLAMVATMAFAGGVVSSFAAMVALPLAEWAFNFTTDVKLAELSEDDHPLLRWLHIQAPGTYNHSVMVGRLAEVAAEAIGADALLVKVGAYYHDIGKALMPQYFVENQKDYNPHEDLKPSMSALTIISHVTKGRDIAEEHRLPRPLIDFILEHHGTSLVEYFFTKAIDVAEQDNLPPPEEHTYRYPGPRPQTKESGILMLADMVEATSRVLTKPTEANIKGMVHRLINKAFTDGQLDECPLTLQDLHLIAKSFSTVLEGMLHARVTYPSNLADGKSTKQEPKQSKKDEPEDHNPEPPGEDGDIGEETDTDARESIKRLGIS